MQRSEEALLRQKARIQVKISTVVRDVLAPVFRSHNAAKVVQEVALDLTLLEITRLLYEEPIGNGDTNSRVVVTPSPALVAKAASYYLPPHTLVRAAANKLAERIKDGEAVEDMQKAILLKRTKRTSQSPG